MKIIITDYLTVTNGDLSLDLFEQFGEVVLYPLTPHELLQERIKDADIILTNKSLLNKEILISANKLKYIGLFATGYNNVDIDYCNRHNITVCNAGNYSTGAVAQHTFALILEHFSKINKYNSFVAGGNWKISKTFSPFIYQTQELSAKTIGLIGYGSIGKAVAKVACAFNMNVLVYTRTTPVSTLESDIKFTDLNTLLRSSDIVSVHCPLNTQSEKMFNKDTFAKFKSGAFFVNTSRGGIIVEEDLYEALDSGKLSGAGVDVLTTEPMNNDCILYNAPNITITPHVAWSPAETRLRLINIVSNNIKAYLSGNPCNVVTNIFN